jgi:glycosyltransferase involved in cell wall biosynthesis
VITVNEELARIYQERYRVPVEVIRNVPELIPGKNDVENSRGFRENHTLIYQGALNMGRGIELMIDSMPLLDDCTLILAGEGDISAALKTRVESKGLTDRILFKGRLDPKVLRDLTRTADLGLSLEEDLGLNYRYALPNKIFDYIHAGIPVVVSDLPVMGGFVREHKVGEILSDRSPEALARRVREVLSKRETYSPCLNAAALEFNWDNEKVKFLKLLENLEKNLEHR